jgi:hypothetical protein
MQARNIWRRGSSIEQQILRPAGATAVERRRESVVSSLITSSRRSGVAADNVSAGGSVTSS